MALRGLALAFLLVLAPLLLVWGQKDAGPKNQEGAKETGKSGLHLSPTKKVLLLFYLYICYMALPCSAHSSCVGKG